MSTNNKYDIPNNLYDKLITKNIAERTISGIMELHPQDGIRRLDFFIDGAAALPPIIPVLKELREYLVSISTDSGNEPELTTAEKFKELTNNPYYKIYKDKGENLHDMDKELSVYMIEDIVKTKGLSALMYIPVALFTDEFCKEFVSVDGGALAFVPANMRTIELCALALETNYMAYRYIPENIPTDSLPIKTQMREIDVIVNKFFISKEACASSEYAEIQDLLSSLDTADAIDSEVIMDQISILVSIWRSSPLT